MKFRNNDNILLKLSKNEVKRLKRNLRELRMSLALGDALSTKEEQKIQLQELKNRLLEAKSNLKNELSRDEEINNQRKAYHNRIKELKNNLSYTKKKEIKNEFRKIV